MTNDPNEYFVEADDSHNYEKRQDGSWKWGYSPESKATQFPPGVSGNAKGRPEGSKNKKTLRQELADKGGLTPAELLYSIMNDENANIGQRMKAAEKLLDFTEAKLSSIEVHTDEDNKAPFNIFLSETPTETVEEGEDELPETGETGEVAEPAGESDGGDDPRES